jgi:hypothetical protein
LPSGLATPIGSHVGGLKFARCRRRIFSAASSHEVLPQRHDGQNTLRFSRNAMSRASGKNISLCRKAETDVSTSPSRLLQEDVTANRHETWGGKRWTRRSRRRCEIDAYGQAVWSRLPDAGDKLAKMICERRGLTSPVPRGEHGAAEKTIAQGMPGSFRRTLGDYARMLFSSCIRGCGCSWRPAFPAPSSIEDAMLRKAPDAKIAPRER